MINVINQIIRLISTDLDTITALINLFILLKVFWESKSAPGTI